MRTKRAPFHEVLTAGKSMVESPLFPTEMILRYPNGEELSVPFAAPAPSASSGNLNAYAGTKLVRNGKVLRINCNVTHARA